MLRSLYGSTHPQGDTVHWPERLKLAHRVAVSMHLTSSLLPICTSNLASYFDNIRGKHDTQKELR